MLMTANWPDIFLPSMNESFFNAFLFMTFMLIGFFFLTKLMMANVFNKYQQRLEQRKLKHRK